VVNIKWKIDDKLSYYPRDEVVRRVKKLLIYLLKKGDRVGISETLAELKLKLSPIWIDRLDKFGAIKLESNYKGGRRLYGRNPVKFYVRLWDKKKAKEILSHELKLPKSFKDEQMSSRILKHMEEQIKTQDNDIYDDENEENEETEIL